MTNHSEGLFVHYPFTIIKSNFWLPKDSIELGAVQIKYFLKVIQNFFKLIEGWKAEDVEYKQKVVKI